MLSQDEQIALFVDAINKNALKMRRETEKETKKLYLEETQKLEERAKRDMEEKLSYAEKKLFTEFNKKVASDKAYYRAELCRRREELTEDIFEKAKKLLLEFSFSEEYNGFLVKSIKKISEYLHSDLVLRVKCGDKEKVCAAAKEADVRCSVIEDKSIIIGGIKAESEKENKNVNDTLDERLLEARDSFISLTAGKLII